MQVQEAEGRTKQRWIIATFFFLSGIQAASWSSRIPDIQHKLSLDNKGLGTVLFALPVGLVIGMMLGGRLVAHYGTKRIMLLTCLMTALALLTTSLTSTSFQLMLALFAMGMSRTIYNLSINTSAVELQKKYEKPIVSSFHGIWSVACLLAALIGTAVIIANINPFLHFLGATGVCVAVVLFMMKKRTAPVVPTERKPFFVKPDRPLFLLGLIALCAMLCESAVFDWSVNYFEKVVKVDKSLVTTGYTSFIVTMALGRLLGDRLIAFWGIYRMLCINGTLMATGFALVSFFPSLWPASAGFLLIGLGDSILVPMIYMLASRSEKMTSSYALQAVTLIGYGGFLIGPLFIGNVSQHWGMPVAFALLSAISLLIIVLSLQVKKRLVKA